MESKNMEQGSQFRDRRQIVGAFGVIALGLGASTFGSGFSVLAGALPKEPITRWRPVSVSFTNTVSNSFTGTFSNTYSNSGNYTFTHSDFPSQTLTDSYSGTGSETSTLSNSSSGTETHTITVRGAASPSSFTGEDGEEFLSLGI